MVTHQWVWTRPAALIAQPVRAAMLMGLLDGRSVSAGDLARAARVSAATARENLARLAATKHQLTEPLRLASIGIRHNVMSA